MREVHPRRLRERERTPASQSLSILQLTLDFRRSGRERPITVYSPSEKRGSPS